MSKSPVYTISKFAKKFAKKHPLLGNLKTLQEEADRLNRQTTEEREAERLESTREELALRKEARKAWKEAREWRLLARRLGVRRIVVLSESFRDFQADYLGGECVVRINVYQSSCEEGLSEVFAHELGHHIDWIAHSWFSGADADKRFVTAFKRAGLRADPMTRHEMIAEILGKYLCGHVLTVSLLAEANKILAKLPRQKMKLIKEFRSSQIARKELAA